MAHWQTVDGRRLLLCQLKAKCCILNAAMTQQVATPQDTRTHTATRGQTHPHKANFVGCACGNCCSLLLSACNVCIQQLLMIICEKRWAPIAAGVAGGVVLPAPAI